MHEADLPFEALGPSGYQAWKTCSQATLGLRTPQRLTRRNEFPSPLALFVVVCGGMRGHVGGAVWCVVWSMVWCMVLCWCCVVLCVVLCGVVSGEW
jgi:hypothetical protein